MKIPFHQLYAAIICSLLIAVGPAGAQVTTLKLTTTFPNPTPEIFEYFGFSVAAVGSERVLIGDKDDRAVAFAAGAAYLFSTNGTLVTTFTNPAPDPQDYFGNSVAGVGSDRVLIGASSDDGHRGSAYLFGTNGTLLTTFTNPASEGGDFGATVAAVGGDRVLIGCIGEKIGDTNNAGAAYLFSTNGTLLTRIPNPNPKGGDGFGFSVAVLGSDRVIIGSPGQGSHAIGCCESSGTAYLFHANGTLLATFNNPTPATNDAFGVSVAAAGSDRVLIGAYSDDTGAENAGAAYLFSTNGTLLTTFTNPTPEVEEGFGIAVAALGPNLMVIGARGDDAGLPGIGTIGAGSVYLFRADGTLWMTVTNPTPVVGDFFGWPVAVMGADRLLIGATGDSTGALSAGSAYMYTLNVPQPRLTIARGDEEYLISWTTDQDGLVFEQSDRLGSSATWSNMTKKVTRSGSTNVFHDYFDTLGTNRFFRIRRP